MHVRHAVEMSEEIRASARADFDLDAIRNEPAFKQLINNQAWRRLKSVNGWTTGTRPQRRADTCTPSCERTTTIGRAESSVSSTRTTYLMSSCVADFAWSHCTASTSTSIALMTDLRLGKHVTQAMQ
jgi:hypothetical protein